MKRACVACDRDLSAWPGYEGMSVPWYGPLDAVIGYPQTYHFPAKIMAPPGNTLILVIDVCSRECLDALLDRVEKSEPSAPS